MNCEQFQLCVIPGDGIGREVIPAALDVLKATGLPFAAQFAEAGWECFQRTDTALPEATLAAARAADAVLFGAVASPSFPVVGYRSPIVGLRQALDLYANIRPVHGVRIDRERGRPGDKETGRTKNQACPERSRREPRTSSTLQRFNASMFQCSNPPILQSSSIDLVVVRENTEGLYAGRERVEDAGDTAIAERVITRHASERIVRAAFELARSRRQGDKETRRPRDRELRTDAMFASQPVSPYHLQSTIHNPQPLVTIVHKANVLRETCGLFRRVALEVAQEYPDVVCRELLVDTCALQLVQNPEQFDVIVTTNLFGDILSDVAAYWEGGLGLATSANIGTRSALFEPVHGAAPDIAGRGIANPLAAIGCVAMLLRHLSAKNQESRARRDAMLASSGDNTAGQINAGDLATWATRIQTAVSQVTALGPHTPDMGGTATTMEVTQAVINAL